MLFIHQNVLRAEKSFPRAARSFARFNGLPEPLEELKERRLHTLIVPSPKQSQLFR